MRCETLALVLFFVHFAGVGSNRAELDAEEWVHRGRCLPIQAKWLCSGDGGQSSRLSKDDKGCIAKLCDEQEKTACCDTRQVLLDSGKAQISDFAYEGSPGFSMPASPRKRMSYCSPIHARLLCPNNPKFAKATSKKRSQCIARLCDEEHNTACCNVRQALLDSKQAQPEDFISESTGPQPREGNGANDDNDEAVDEYREQPEDFSPESSDFEGPIREISGYEEVDGYRDLLSDAGRAAILEEGQESTTPASVITEDATHEKWTAEARNKYASRFQHIVKADIDAAEEKYSDPAEAGKFLLLRNLANRLEAKCTEEEVRHALEAHNWEAKPTIVALLGFRNWCTELKKGGKGCDLTSENKVNWAHFFENPSEQIAHSLKAAGLAIKKNIQACCGRAKLDKTTQCDTFTCQQRGERNREWYYAAQTGVCNQDWQHTHNNNRAGIHVFSKACPEMPLCREEKMKYGTFVMKDNGRGNHESTSNHFDWPGIIESISFETLPPDQKECKFAVFNPITGETFKLGKIESGGDLMEPVFYSDQLVWWGCDIPAQDLDIYEKQVEEQPDMISLPDMLFPSLKVTYSPSQLPLVAAEHTEKSVKLVIRSRSAGMPLVVAVNVLSGTSWETRSEVSLKAEGPEKDTVVQNAYSPEPGQVYRIDITTESGGYVRVYKVSETVGCPSDEKCCQYQETRKNECVQKSGKWFTKTCASVPGRIGARSAAGKRSDEGCRYCNAEELLEGMKETADIHRWKKRGGDMCQQFQTNSEGHAA